MATAPNRRGYRQVILSEEAYAGLTAYKEGLALPSMGAAVLRALSDAQRPDPVAIDVEALIGYCRLGGTPTAQKLREYLGG